MLFDDPYFSTSGGLEETAHVFLQGNDLPARFSPGFHIAELGFGTGLNLLAAWQAWRESGISTPLHFTSFEAYPLALPDMRRALAQWPELAPLADILLKNHPFQARLKLPDLVFTLIIGDARTTLPRWQGRADAWFLDGFSPSKNPEMWGDDLLDQVGQHSAPNASFATYTAAGFVRRALEPRFNVRRVSGFGRKRHMSVGRLRG